MTTRTIVSNNLFPVTLDCGNGYVGSYFMKSQAGANSLPGQPRRVNAYSMVEESWFDNQMLWRHDGLPPDVWKSGTWASCFGTFVLEDPAIGTNANLRLVNKLGSKISNHEFNAAVSVGAEGKEALMQVTAKTMEIYRGFKNLRKGNIGGALKEFGLSPKHAKKVGLHKDLSGRVLATQLGWIPLFNDVKDAAEAYHALTVKPRKVSHSASVRERGRVFTITGEVDCGSVFISRRIHWTLSEELSWNQSLSLSNGWDLADAVWNGAPLSFIADWFIPIGSYLEARSLASTLKGSGYMTDFYKLTARSASSFGPYTVRNSQYRYSKTKVTRTPLSELDGLVSLPSWKDPKKVPSLRRAVVSIALATQMFL